MFRHLRLLLHCTVKHSNSPGNTVTSLRSGENLIPATFRGHFWI